MVRDVCVNMNVSVNAQDADDTFVFEEHSRMREACLSEQPEDYHHSVVGCLHNFTCLKC